VLEPAIGTGGPHGLLRASSPPCFSASAIPAFLASARNLQAWARGLHARRRFGGNRTRSQRRPPAPARRQSRWRSPIRRSARREIATEFRNAILRKTTVGAKADTEMICGRLMFDAAVLGRLPHSAQSPARAYNGQRLHLRPSLARSTISESRDTKCEVDQGREIAKIGAVLFCEGNQAIAPVSSEFGGMVRLVGSDRKPADTFG
jgi:hypothetical protein